MGTLTRYFVIQNLAGVDEALVIRYSGLLRGTESAWQAVSYGLAAVTVFAQYGGVYLNFALWAVSALPAWLVLRHFGADKQASLEDRSPSSAVAESDGHAEEHIK